MVGSWSISVGKDDLIEFLSLVLMTFTTAWIGYKFYGISETAAIQLPIIAIFLYYVYNFIIKNLVR